MGGLLGVLGAEVRRDRSGLRRLLERLDAVRQRAQDISAGDPAAQVLAVIRQDREAGAPVQGELAQRLLQRLVAEELLGICRGPRHRRQGLASTTRDVVGVGRRVRS